ncbi:MAG TPA: hypothetical protein VFR35_04810, partial [Actinoplanes sp.]|nr:hypothetical protein [Actinoplanes sp.]
AGGVLSALGVLAAAVIHTPVGLNATRLVTMFALPLLAGYAAVPALRRRESSQAATPDRPPGEAATPDRPPGEATTPDRPPGEATSPDRPPGEAGSREPGPAGRPRRIPAPALVALLAAVTWWQPPVVVADLRDIGNPTAEPAYFRPLRDRLARLPLTGRVEIPPTRDYWESAHLGDIPLARGWLRQADIDRNPLFFTTVPGAPGTGVPLTAGSYRNWLASHSVQYVAVPDTELSWVGRAEAELIRRGMPYLTPIWSDAGWRLYAVADPQPIVAPPARLVGQDAVSLTFDAPDAGEVTVRVRHYRWLTATGNAVVEPSGVWTLLRVPAPGRYTLTSGI